MPHETYISIIIFIIVTSWYLERFYLDTISPRTIATATSLLSGTCMFQLVKLSILIMTSRWGRKVLKCKLKWLIWFFLNLFSFQFGNFVLSVYNDQVLIWKLSFDLQRQDRLPIAFNRHFPKLCLEFWAINSRTKQDFSRWWFFDIIKACVVTY